VALKFAGIPDRHILIKLINRLWLEVGLLCEYFVIATNSYILITAFPFSLFNSSEMYWQKRLWSFFAGRGGGGACRRDTMVPGSYTTDYRQTLFYYNLNVIEPNI
jgi:hypothetical protein